MQALSDICQWTARKGLTGTEPEFDDSGSNYCIVEKLCPEPMLSVVQKQKRRCRWVGRASL